MNLIEKVEAQNNAAGDQKTTCQSDSQDTNKNPLQNENKQNSTLRMVINKLVALVILLFLLPAFLIIIILIKIYDPGPIFYSGARLGYKKTMFYIFKFRTLPVGAQEKIGAEIYSSKHGMHTRLGNFLRETRLDELPQFINVLLGDMVLVGPRPVRPEVYQKLCATIPRYDRRFLMYPGLVGYTQLFTPHSTPKHIRAYINNNLSMREGQLLKDIQIACYGTRALICNMAKKVARLFLDGIINTKLLNRYTEKRRLQRVILEQAQICFAPFEENTDKHAKTPAYRYAGYLAPGLLKDINETHCRFWTNEKLTDQIYSIRMETSLKKGGRSKNKRAYGRGQVVVKRATPPRSEYQYEYVIIYESESPLQKYIIDKYYLKMSIA
ncbi:sugar transferase [Maridesulfovibrio frigidus]|uniref:sugar transferase n=1 Tax=Maridesulfovibrio frigidus TaxID=340956 RepID=UPI00068D23F2|nr:sugar transferase [Maridesulfovibrio frigidus]